MRRVSKAFFGRARRVLIGSLRVVEASEEDGEWMENNSISC